MDAEILVGKPFGERRFDRPRRWGHNIKINLMERGPEVGVHSCSFLTMLITHSEKSSIIRKNLT
jgi:hypothetical protein